jgi:hypothetical protein
VNTWLNFANGGFAGPVFLAVSVVGLALSGLAWRRRGARSGIRGIAWSLLPAAAWLTSSLGLVGRLVSAIVRYAGTFAFSPKAWTGVILVAIAALFFLISGGMPLTRRSRRGGRKPAGQAPERAELPQRTPGASGRQAISPPADDLADVRDILKKHGIS